LRLNILRDAYWITAAIRRLHSLERRA
jgi:hypothetical protein